MKAKIIRLTAWIAAIVIVLAGSFIYWHHSTLYPSTDDAYVQAHVMHIAPQITGPIKTIYIQNNQFVKKDSPLFDIDPTAFVIAVNAAEAKYDLAKQNVRALYDTVETAQALVLQRESELKVTEKNAERIYILVRSQQEPIKSRDDMNNEVRVAKAALYAAKSQLAEAKENLGDIGKHNAQVRAAQAALNQAKLDLAHTHISAPDSGEIVNFTEQVGNIVSPGVPLFDIVNQNEWWVNANFKETQLARIKPGQQATITLDIYPDHEFVGFVGSISAGSGSAFSLLPPENATGNWVKVTQRIPVKVIIIHSDPRFPLRVGASATVKVNTTR